MPTTSRARRGLAVAVVLSLAAFGAVAFPHAASAAPTGLVASGSDWSVTTAPGGYRVTLRLDRRLPLVSDAPTLVADGRVIGLATESADGLSLSLTTADPSVAGATTVEKGWASGSGQKAAEQEGDGESPDDARRSPAPEERDADPTTEDPAAGGTFSVTEAEYDFGDRAIPLVGIGDVRGEMTGKLYLTDAPGARPTVVLLHGRHAVCGSLDPDAEPPAGWPCAPGELNVRSYLGYEGTGEALASHGYNVVSVAANAVNWYDNQALDFGAQARGQLVLDTLAMLRAASAGQPVSFDDVTTNAGSGTTTTVTRSLDDALQYATTRTDQPAAASGLTASALIGRFDLAHVGLMGHSRGGEGVVTAALLNQSEAEPFGITSVLPLAPTDFARRTLPDAVTAVVLPYCDGDVSDQQGQHYIDDSRHAFGDDVQRSAVWVMGANHNFFSTVWTPGEYPVGTADDWRESGDSSCSTENPTRLTAPQQYQVGVSLMTGFFRATLGGETQFQPLFDGSVVAPTTSATGFADVRLMASAPAPSTTLVTDFTRTDGTATTNGAQLRICSGANTSAGSVPAPCSMNRDTPQLPHWSPGLFAPDVPTLTAGVLTWPAAADFGTNIPTLVIPLAEDARDVSGRTQLSLKIAPEENSSDTMTDVTVTIRDGAGAAFTRTASELNPHALTRMPGGGGMILDKIVLQQLTILTAEMTGIDLTDVRSIEIAAVAADTGPWVTTGGVYLSDLAFESPSAGVPGVPARVAVGMSDTRIDEGDGESTAHVAVAVDRATDVPVIAYANVLVWGEGSVHQVSERVTFAPGQTCLTVPLQVAGDDSASDEGYAEYRLSATTTGTGVMGAAAFAELTVREDDDAETPAFGIQGDACAEREAAGTTTPLQIDATDLAVDGTVTVTATGYRVGEAVRITLGATTFEPEIADASGTVTRTLTVPLSAGLGPQRIVAYGEGSQRTQAADVTVRAPTAVMLTATGGASAGESVTFIATVSGADTNGTVSFVDGPGGSGSAGDQARTAVSGGLLGSATVENGVATLILPGGLTAGSHAVVASFAQTGTALASSSSPLALSVSAAGGGGSGVPGGSGGSLAGTGGDGVAGWMLLATALLLVAGGTAIAVRRRRRAARD